MNGLQEQRTRKGYSQTQLANLSGVKLRAIQQYEIDARDINKAQVNTVYRLAHVLGCDIMDIIDVDKEKRFFQKKELVDRIQGCLDKKAIKTGAMGTETVSVTLNLSSEEKELFLDVNEFDNERYWWEFDGNNLSISYKEDVE